VFLSFFLLAVLTAISGKSAKIITSWFNPNYKGQTFHKILVIGIAQNLEVRADFEDEMAAQIARPGIETIPGNQILLRRDPKVKLDLDYLRGQIRDNHVDAVVVSRLLKIDKKVTSIPSSTYIAPYPYYYSLYGYLGVVYPLDRPRSGQRSSLAFTKNGCAGPTIKIRPATVAGLARNWQKGVSRIMSERHRSTNWKCGRIQGTLFNRHLLFEQTLSKRSRVQDSDFARTTRKHALQPLASTGEIGSPRSPSLRGPRRTKLRHRHAHIKDRTRCRNFTTQSPPRSKDRCRPESLGSESTLSFNTACPHVRTSASLWS
jgi:hypothetical protein